MKYISAIYLIHKYKKGDVISLGYPHLKFIVIKRRGFRHWIALIEKTKEITFKALVGYI